MKEIMKFMMGSKLVLRIKRMLRGILRDFKELNRTKRLADNIDNKNMREDHKYFH